MQLFLDRIQISSTHRMTETHKKELKTIWELSIWSNEANSLRWSKYYSDWYRSLRKKKKILFFQIKLQIEKISNDEEWQKYYEEIKSKVYIYSSMIHH